jgi:Protein of unknown function (DUF992)
MTPRSLLRRGTAPLPHLRKAEFLGGENSAIVVSRMRRLEETMKRLVALIALFALPAMPVQAATRVEIGLLECVVEAGTGFIIGSTKHFSCTFDPAQGRRTEHYSGTVRKFGLDIGHTGRTIIKWAVLAPTTTSYSSGALSGNYVGASAEATLGVGLGANALVGGSNKAFVLQPVSVQAQEGLNLAVGFSSFELRRAH